VIRPTDRVSIEAVGPDSEAARAALRLYVDDVASRYYGRQATCAEIDAALADDPSDDLAAPDGVLLVAFAAAAASADAASADAASASASSLAAVVGCAGLRVLPGGIGEVCRVFVTVSARGGGLGARLMAELERLARARDLRLLRLDTRHDLVEARRLYARLGFREVPPFNADRYAEHWFAKALPAPVRAADDDSNG